MPTCVGPVPGGDGDGVLAARHAALTDAAPSVFVQFVSDPAAALERPELVLARVFAPAVV